MTAGTLSSRRMRRAAPLPNWVRGSALIRSSDMLWCSSSCSVWCVECGWLGAGDETCTALQTGTVHGEPRSGHVDHGGQSLAEATERSYRTPHPVGQSGENSGMPI